MMTRIAICLTFTVLFLYGCSNLEDIRKKVWKYIDGYEINDILYFHTSAYRLDENGNIYREDEFAGTVNYTLGSDRLYIESPSGEEGIYRAIFNVDTE